MSTIYKIQVVVGSARANRIGRSVAEWVRQQIPASLNLETELVDLADWHLPLSDEPNIPATGDYTQAHTKAWSRKVAAADGFVFVTPQYNWGYPASLKNALDHLYKEWTLKPAIIVSYGYHGGDKAAAQLLQVLNGIRMRPATTMPQITLTKESHGEDGQIRDLPAAFAPFAESISKAAAELSALLQTPKT